MNNNKLNEVVLCFDNKGKLNSISGCCKVKDFDKQIRLLRELREQNK